MGVSVIFKENGKIITRIKSLQGDRSISQASTGRYFNKLVTVYISPLQAANHTRCHVRTVQADPIRLIARASIEVDRDRRSSRKLGPTGCDTGRIHHGEGHRIGNLGVTVVLKEAGHIAASR